MKKTLSVVIMTCTFILCPLATQEAPENDENIAKTSAIFKESEITVLELKEPTYVFGSELSDILMADLAGFGLSFSTVGLNFLTGAILGSDGNYTICDQIISSSITQLSCIPLFISKSPDAFPLTITGGLLLGGEYLSMKEYGLFSREQQWFYWAKNNLAMYNAYCN